MELTITITELHNAYNVVTNALPYILHGAVYTIILVVSSMILGFILALPLSVGQVYGCYPIRKLVSLYVAFFRGIPILVLLYLFYFGLFDLLHLNMSGLTASIVVLGMTSAAYQSQIFRGSILALPQGQLKAAYSLGMTKLMAIRFIVLPQALRLSISGWSNEYSILLKDSALAYVLGTLEIMARTHFVASRTREYHLYLYITAAVIYFILTWIGVYWLRKLELKTKMKGYQ